MTAHRLSLDDGIDAAARNARRSERTRGISTIVCALVLGANLTPLAGLGWFFASIFALILCAFVCSRADDDRTLSQPQRVMVVAAILLETFVWSGSALMYWLSGAPALQLVAMAVTAGQLIHAQSFNYRSRLPLLASSAPPAILMLLMPVLFSHFHGLQLYSFMAAVGVLIYYTVLSAASNHANMVALEEQKSFATGVIDAIDARIGVVDGKGKIIAANRVWRERIQQLQLFEGKLVGTHFQDHCNNMPGRQGRALARGLKRVLDGEEQRLSFAFRSDMTPQSEWFKLVASRLEGAGEAKLVVVQHRITEMKRTEAKLRRTNLTLSRAREEAEAANKAKSTFLATMSHEIRTPLNGVVAIADVLSRAPLGEAELDMVETIKASADTLSHLLADMLDLARIESGRVELESKPFHLADAVRSIVALNTLTADEKGILLWTEIAPQAETWVSGDVTRVKQILSNLVSNAVKFTNEGQVMVRVSGAGDNDFDIVVADTGVGFDPAEKERLFDRFEQADSSITRRFGGSGLGLAIIRELAAFMGGAFDCDSRPGEGSTFKVTLPLPAAATPDRAAEPVLHAASTDAGLCVLVVDDHPTNRKVVDLILRGVGAQLTMAENGQEAVDAFRAKSFDLILMDMQMPVMDGVAATRAIRTLEAEQNLAPTPVIMFSANALAEHLAQSYAAGADLHLSKPVSAAGLLSAMAKVLDPDAQPQNPLATLSVQA